MRFFDFFSGIGGFRLGMEMAGHVCVGHCEIDKYANESYGWKFLFQTQHENWNEPPVVWDTFDQVYEWLYKYTVESDNYVIIDEYDEVISFKDFIEMVEDKQSVENPDNFKYNKNVNGYRFADGEFS